MGAIKVTFGRDPKKQRRLGNQYAVLALDEDNGCSSIAPRVSVFQNLCICLDKDGKQNRQRTALTKPTVK